MDLRFQKIECPFLRLVTSSIQNGEQTQEIRLPEGMPDIGRVIGCWGQVLTRGKDWHGNAMSINGGVMAWVMYLPEDGTDPRIVDCWIPFTMRWDFPETQRDGSIIANVSLRSIDSRTTSARKLMVRSVVSVFGSAYEPSQADLYDLDTVPEDVQVLKHTYPLEIPREAGEKNFRLEDVLTPQENNEKIRKIVYFDLQPVVTDQKVMAGKAVFKGNCNLEIVYLSESGSLEHRNTSVQFSQFADLELEHDADANVMVTPMLTGAEVELQDNGEIRINCSLNGQYLVYDRVMVNVMEDVYSPRRKLEFATQNLTLPVRLECRTESVAYTHTVTEGQKAVLDLSVLPNQPQCTQTDEMCKLPLSMQFQMVTKDENGMITSTNGKIEQEVQFATGFGNYTAATVLECTKQARQSGDGVEISGKVNMQLQTFCMQTIPMVCEIKLGELEGPDPSRPSLVIRRMGEDGLWDLAKECGSTVEAIRSANKIETDPPEGKLLLIPVF